LLFGDGFVGTGNLKKVIVINYPDLLSAIEKLDSTQPIGLAIDGVAGSGKTTLASRLCGDLKSCQVVHMDDLYEGWNDPLSQRLTAKVIRELLEPFNQQIPIRYQKFDWILNRFDKFEDLKTSNILILEGVGSGQREFRKYLSKTIWVEYDPSQGFDRVIARDGEGIRGEMVNFLLDQNKHFIAELTKNASDYTISGAP
jgi:uridine kinase